MEKWEFKLIKLNIRIVEDLVYICVVVCLLSVQEPDSLTMVPAIEVVSSSGPVSTHTETDTVNTVISF